MSPYNLEPFNQHPFNPFSNVFALRLNFYTCAPKPKTVVGEARGHLTHAARICAGNNRTPSSKATTWGASGGRDGQRSAVPSSTPLGDRPAPGNPSAVFQKRCLAPPVRPPMALTVQKKAVVCRPARSVPPAHPQHLAAPVQPSRGLPHGCGRRMAGRAAARARLRIREAAQALPFRPAAPPPAAKMAAGRGPSSNHFRFRYGRRSRWRECFPAEGWGWRKYAVVHRRIGVVRLRIRRRCF